MASHGSIHLVFAPLWTLMAPTYILVPRRYHIFLVPYGCIIAMLLHQDMSLRFFVYCLTALWAEIFDGSEALVRPRQLEL